MQLTSNYDVSGNGSGYSLWRGEVDVIHFTKMLDAGLIRSESGSSQRVFKQVLRFYMIHVSSFKVPGNALFERSICPFVKDLAIRMNIMVSVILRFAGFWNTRFFRSSYNPVSSEIREILCSGMRGVFLFSRFRLKYVPFNPGLGRLSYTVDDSYVMDCSPCVSIY